MRTGIHPDNYRLVVFEDLNNGQKFLTKSTVISDQTVKWSDGQTYPLVKVHITSASHPFYTGQEKLIDVEGRVDKFKARQQAAAAAQEQRQAGSQKPPPEPKPKKTKSASKSKAKTPATKSSERAGKPDKQ